MKIGLLTSGGDCQGLNACLRGVSKTLYHMVPDVEIYGIHNGFFGLMSGEWRLMDKSEFSGILRQGGTILGASRKSKNAFYDSSGKEVDKNALMVENYRKGGFDALVILGGDGTHRQARELADLGVNIVTLPKTIDNDIWGTDLTFGFDSAVDKATSVVDAIHTTAASHGRVFIIELMGHKVGWIALYAGIAGGADVILIPEIPYNAENVAKVIQGRNESGKHFSIIAIAEGALTEEETKLPPEEIKKHTTRCSSRLAKRLEDYLEPDQDVRLAIPGHFQRGGEPTPTDRMLCSRFGAKAGDMILNGDFGKMVALCGSEIVGVPLGDVVGRLKSVPTDSEILHQGRLLGISFGN